MNLVFGVKHSIWSSKEDSLMQTCSLKDQSSSYEASFALLWLGHEQFHEVVYPWNGLYVWIKSDRDLDLLLPGCCWQRCISVCSRTSYEELKFILCYSRSFFLRLHLQCVAVLFQISYKRLVLLLELFLVIRFDARISHQRASRVSPGRRRFAWRSNYVLNHGLKFTK